MKKVLAIILSGLLCISFAGCSATPGSLVEKDSKKSKKVVNKGANYSVVSVDGDDYYQVEKKYNKEFSIESFYGEWLDNLLGDDIGEEYRYISINGSTKTYIDADSKAYDELKHGKIVDFDEYEELCENYSFNRAYDDEDMNYIVIMYASTSSWVDFYIVDIEFGDEIDYYYYEDSDGVMASGDGYFCVVPTDADTDTELNLIRCHTEDELKNLKKYGSFQDPSTISEDKPVIYLYPVEDGTNVDVSLELMDAEFSCTYPAYNDGWSVVADKDGLITVDGKEYNYLYWEAISYVGYTIDEGYCVKGSDTAAFLETKLEELGLNRREANEFIVYWLPLMEQNEYNVISFDTEEYENRHQLNVSPAPDTVIRVFMTWYATDEFVDIKPQSIITPERTGFTVVEWGGSEIQK